MKQLIIRCMIAVLLLPCMKAQAEDFVDVQFLVLTQTDGTVTKFALQEAPMLTFSGNDMVVTCGNDQLATSLADVADYRFVTEKVSTGIERVYDDGPRQQSEVSFRNAQVTGLKAGSAVTVYDLSGNAVCKIAADAEGKADISLSQLPKGIYLLRTPTKSFKMTAR